MEHFFERIPGWFKFGALYKSEVERADEGAVFVEIGSWKGRSAAFMAVEIVNSQKAIDFYCVDHFLGSQEEAHYRDRDVRAGNLYEVFTHNIRKVKDHIKVLAMPSVEASERFNEGTVDFIMIDGGHDYDSVKADIEAWLPKMKEGGVMGFDDANWKGVKQAVAEFFPDAEFCGHGKGTYYVVRL